MKKIRLDLDELEVASFATDTVPEARGTVRGRQYTHGGEVSCYQVCFHRTDEFETCWETGVTCGLSCDWGCGDDHTGYCESNGLPKCG